jgi:hypothetical protein
MTTLYMYNQIRLKRIFLNLLKLRSQVSDWSETSTKCILTNKNPEKQNRTQNESFKILKSGQSKLKTVAI